jgi:hypothetical protein
MPKLRVSKNFIGEMVLPVVNDRILTANSTFSLSDVDFNHYTIKAAIRMGYLVVEGVVPKQEEDKPIDSKKSASTKVAESIKQAVKIAENKEGKRVESQAEETKEEKTISVEEINEKSKMFGWDANSQKLLNKNESSQKALKNNNAQILDDKTEENKVETHVSKTGKTYTGKKRGRKNKSISPVGEIKEEVNADQVDDDDVLGARNLPPAKIGDIIMEDTDEITFVDQVQENERIAARKSVNNKK